MNWLFRIISAGCFQSTHTPDPVLNEKRAREKRMLKLFVISFFSLLLAALLYPTEVVATDSVLVITERVKEIVHIGAVIFCLLSATWGFVESIGYWRFLRKWS